MGIVLHSTRGSAPDLIREFTATLRWFADPRSQASAHVVIAHDGTLAEVVDPDLVAWHAGWLNAEWLGVELVQPRPGDPISDEQYRSLAWWCREMARRYGFGLSRETLVEHKDTPQGRAAGKSDIGPPFSVERLLELLWGAG